MMNTCLVDTNVLSGLLSRDEFYLKGVEKYLDFRWAISAMTEFELWLYREKYDFPRKAFVDFLEPLVVFPLERDVFELAAKLFSKRKQPKPHMADLLIVATAILHDLPLLTADKDMKKYSQAEVVVLK